MIPLTPEQIAAIEQQIAESTLNLRESEALVNSQTISASQRQMHANIVTAARREITDLQRRLQENRDLLARMEQERVTAEKRAAEKAAAEKAAEELRAYKAEQARLAEEQRAKEAEEKRLAQEEAARARELSRKMQAESAAKQKRDLARKNAVERRKKEEAERRLVLEADGRGQSSKWSLRLKVGDQEVDLLIEAKPVAK